MAGLESPTPGRARLAAGASYLSNLTAGISLAIGFVIIASSLIITARGQIPGPIRDFWTFIPLLEALDRGESLMPLLYKLHGGAHRLVVPKLLHLVEYSFFQGKNTFLMIAGVVTHLISTLILLRTLANKSNGLQRNELVFAFGLILALTFSATQFTNFLRPWNIHWYLCTSGMIGAFACLLHTHDSDLRGRPGRAWSWWVGTVAAGLIANFSMGNGLLVWPSLLLMGFLLGMRVRFLASSAVAGFIAFRVFHVFRDLTSKLLERPVEIILWMLKCLGVPISWDNQVAGMVMGALGICAGAALALRLLRRRVPPLSAECLLLGLMTVSLGSIAMASIGRSGANWYPPRYQTVVLLYWLSLALLGLLAFRNPKRNRRFASSVIMLATTLWLAGIILPAHAQSIRDANRVVNLMRLAKIAILMEVDEHKLYEIVLPVSDLKLDRDSNVQQDKAVSSRAFMKERRLGVFADGHHELLTRSMNDPDFAARADHCHGEAKSVIGGPSRGTDFTQIRGWVAADPGTELQDIVLLTNSDGAIVGMARTLVRIFDPLEWPHEVPHKFLGFARSSSTSFDVFALTKDGAPCPVARDVPFL